MKVIPISKRTDKKDKAISKKAKEKQEETSTSLLEILMGVIKPEHKE